jgi:hypothetical protein
MWSIPALAKEISLQIDLAAAMIAVIALIFSIWSFRHQRSISIETIRMQRDNDVIKWTHDVLDILVSIEFLLRDWAGHLSAQGIRGAAQRTSRATLRRHRQGPDVLSELFPRHDRH